jgi:predicted nucleic acid-binding protein
MPKRTYLDSGVLLAAFLRDDAVGQRAMHVLDDPERTLLVSDAVWLEVMPKPLHEGRRQEVEFYEVVFAKAERFSWDTSSLVRAADIACQYGIAAMDAIHIATALDAAVEEFVTAEKTSKPMFRVREIAMRSIREDIA